MTLFLEHFISRIREIQTLMISGKVKEITGLSIIVEGIENYASIGNRCIIFTRDKKKILSEVIAVHARSIVVMPYSEIEGIGRGLSVLLKTNEPMIFPSNTWLGRILNAHGESIDGKGPLLLGNEGMKLRTAPPDAHARGRIHGKVDLGITVLNIFTTCCKGQRMGIFSGSGIGKSSIMSMIIRYTDLPIIVIGLIGERGRELQEFIQDDLGEEGLKRSVMVVSTSDESPLMRKQAAFVTMAIAEYFRNQGHDVLCLMDSITRFATAQREIGLSAGEPPISKGYTPTVFVELPKLLERSGPGIHGYGSITGLFTVLVEGDDHNEPIADSVRGILDGHIVLERKIAEKNRYPAVNIFKSISRVMPNCNTEYENYIISETKKIMTLYEDMEELIRLGAYKKGTDSVLDRAIDLYPKISSFLNQNKNQPSNLQKGYEELAHIIGINKNV